MVGIPLPRFWRPSGAVSKWKAQTLRSQTSARQQRRTTTTAPRLHRRSRTVLRLRTRILLFRQSNDIIIIKYDNKAIEILRVF